MTVGRRVRPRLAVTAVAVAALLAPLAVAAPAQAVDHAAPASPARVHTDTAGVAPAATGQTRYFRWASHPHEIFQRTPDGKTTRLTYPQWLSAGSPEPEVWRSGFYRAPWSDIVHAVNADGHARRVSFSEWSALGQPWPALTPVQYVKNPGSSAVYAHVTWPTSPDDRRVGLVVHLTWSEYVRAGMPAVVERSAIPTDPYVKFTVGDTVYRQTGGVLTPIDYSQWQRAGYPTPRVISPPSPAYIRGHLIVNKSFPLPPSFGDGLTSETQTAFDTMRDAASRDGIGLRVVSGFRSYASQQSIYNNRVRNEGRASADRYSARPGHSEHQSGLALDVNSVSPAFAHTREGQWVRDNAHRFGFIVRYPDGKEHITGYAYEPWHLRYVGTDTATLLTTNGWTLEEYLAVPSRY